MTRPEAFEFCVEIRNLHLKTCLIVLYMDEKTSLWVKMPAGPAYKVAKFSEFWSKFL